MADPKADPAELARARKLLEMRGQGDAYRKVAVERKIKALPPHVHAAATGAATAGPTAKKPLVASSPSRAKSQDLPDDYAASHPELSLGEFHFGLLPRAFSTTMVNGDTGTGPVGYGCNLNAKALLEKVKKASEEGVAFFKELDFLHYQQERNLPRLLQEVNDDHDKIAQKARGDEKLATDADAHAEAQERLRQAGKEVESLYTGALAAAAGLKVAIEKKDLRADEKAEEQAEAKLREVNEKADRAKEIIKEGLGQVKELLEKGPIDYVASQAGNVAKYLEDKAIDYLVGDYYAPQREEAEKAVAAAQKVVEDRKSNIELDRIERWTKELQSKKSAYEGSLQGLLAAATHARSVETGLIRETEKTGVDTAAEAVESRDETVKSSNKAKKLVGRQLKACAVIEKDATTLADEYRDYADSFAKLMKFDVDPPISPDDKVRAEIHGIAVGNTSMAKAVQANAAEEMRRCTEAMKFLDAAEYLKQYEQIEQSLSDAVNDR